MDRLDKVLDEITNVSNEYLDIDYKKLIIQRLYKKYYEIKEEMGFNDIFILDSEPVIEDIDYNEVKKITDKYESEGYISLNEADLLLKWVVKGARDFISNLGFNIKNHSLDGFCELAQVLTIYPLEKFGFKVTKNNAINCFDSYINHSFGSVSLNIKDNDQIKEETFLIDATYRQFFKKDNCNIGMYYMNKTPSPGYFVINKVFAKEILKKGFIHLDEYTAKEYGEPFYKSSLELNEKPIKKIDYYKEIKESDENYSYNIEEIEEKELPKLK